MTRDNAITLWALVSRFLPAEWEIDRETPPPHDWKASPTPPAPENSYLPTQYNAYP